MYPDKQLTSLLSAWDKATSSNLKGRLGYVYMYKKPGDTVERYKIGVTVQEHPLRRMQQAAHTNGTSYEMIKVYQCNSHMVDRHMKFVLQSYQTNPPPGTIDGITEWYELDQGSAEVAIETVLTEYFGGYDEVAF